MKIRHVFAMLGIAAVIGVTTGLTRADAQAVTPIVAIDVDGDGTPDGCGGNSTVRDAPIHCGNARTFTVQGVTFTVSVELAVDSAGNGSAIYTLNRTLPRDVPIRVRSHSGISSDPGPLTDDVSGVIPAGQLQAILRFAVTCGQIDVKAVYTAEGDSRGRIAGPYICTPPPSTVPTTAPTTAPGSTTPSSSPGSASSVPTSGPGASSARTLPATGSGPLVAIILGTMVLVVGLVLVGRSQEQAR